MTFFNLPHVLKEGGENAIDWDNSKDLNYPYATFQANTVYSMNILKLGDDIIINDHIRLHPE